MASAPFPIVIAAGQGLVWYGILALLDPVRRGRWLRPLLPMVAGWAAFRGLGWYLGHLHPELLRHGGTIFQGRGLVPFIADIGLREELAKLLAALPFILAARSSKASPLLAAAATGLGFATIENICFFQDHAQPSLFFGRLVGPVSLHVALTGLMGVALDSPGMRWRGILLGLLACAVGHGIYDWAPVGPLTGFRSGGTSWISQVIVAAAIVAFLFSMQRRGSPPPGTRPFGWMLGGFTCLFATALTAAWLRWESPTALSATASECARFLPVAATLAIYLRAMGHRPRGATPKKSIFSS